MPHHINIEWNERRPREGLVGRSARWAGYLFGAAALICCLLGAAHAIGVLSNG